MNKINLFFLLCIACGMAACYEDKGNYEYRKKLDIEVIGIENNYKKLVLDTIHFRPEITPSGREYECFWGVLPEGGSPKQFDTISKVKDWDYVVNLKPGMYKIRFCAKDVETGIFAFQEYTLSVTTDMAVGWWILKEEAGKTDLDVFTPDRKIENVLKLNNGSALEGKPKNIAYVDDWLYFDEKANESVVTKTIFVASEQDVVAVDFFNGSILRNFDHLFYTVPTVKRPQNIFWGVNGVFLVNNDQIHVIMLEGRGATGFFGDAKSGKEVQVSDLKTTSGNRTPLLFDEKSASFFTTSYTSLNLISFKDSPSASSGSDGSPVNNLNADLLYIGVKMGEIYPENTYALMKSRAEEKYLLVKLLSKYTSPYRNPVVKTQELDNSLKILSADFRAMAKDYNLMYFSKGQELWSFDVEQFREVKQNVTIPVDEEITYMEYLRFTPSFDKTKWFNSLMVATNVNGKYKLYRYDVMAGKLQPGVVIGEGGGRIIRACYLYMNGKVYKTDLL